LVNHPEKPDAMRLTTDQRLKALEREVVVLRDTAKLLHKLIREQGKLINDYVFQTVTQAQAESDQQAGRSEDAVYTFVCQKRFDRLEKELKKLRNTLDSLRYRTRAG